MKSRTVTITNEKIIDMIDDFKMENRLEGDDAAVECMLLRLVDNMRTLERISEIGILDLDNEFDYRRTGKIV